MNAASDSTPPDLEELFRSNGEDLMRYFSRRHGAGETSRDLVQETFAQFARAMRGGQSLDCARGYLFGIARHLSQRVWNRHIRDTPLPLDESSAEVAAPEPDDRIEQARETIASLAPLQREILDLRFSQGLSYAEMAEALGVPVGTVRSRLHHAISQLRSRLESDGQKPHPTP